MITPAQLSAAARYVEDTPYATEPALCIITVRDILFLQLPDEESAFVSFSSDGTETEL